MRRSMTNEMHPPLFCSLLFKINTSFKGTKASARLQEAIVRHPASILSVCGSVSPGRGCSVTRWWYHSEILALTASSLASIFIFTAQVCTLKMCDILSTHFYCSRVLLCWVNSLHWVGLSLTKSTVLTCQSFPWVSFFKLLYRLDRISHCVQEEEEDIDETNIDAHHKGDKSILFLISWHPSIKWVFSHDHVHVAHHLPLLVWVSDSCLHPRAWLSQVTTTTLLHSVFSSPPWMLPPVSVLLLARYIVLFSKLWYFCCGCGYDHLDSVLPPETWFFLPAAAQLWLLPTPQFYNQQWHTLGIGQADNQVGSWAPRGTSNVSRHEAFDWVYYGSQSICFL